MTTQPWREAEIEAGRLQRAVRMHVQGNRALGQYEVRSPTGEPHWVNTKALDIPPCDCGDHTWRDVMCAHLIAALWFEGDKRLIYALGVHVHAAWQEHRLYLGLRLGRGIEQLAP